MATTSTKHIFETQAELSGAKAFTNVQKEINKALAEVNRTFENSNKIMSTSSRIVEKDKENLLELGISYKTLGGFIERNTALYRQTSNGLELVSGSLKVTTKSMEDASNKGKGLAESLGGIIQKALLVAPVWLALRAILMTLINSIKEAVRFMIDFQFALAQIRIVGDLTEKDLDKLSKGIVALGVKFGGNFNEMTDAMILWAQQGKNVNEILALMEPTIMSSVINQRSMKDTVEDLTAVMKAYGLGADEVLSVEDKITKIQLQHAISAKDLAEGLRRLGPAASQYNLSLNQTIGLLTAIQTVTRDTGGVAARGANTILNRLAKPENVQKVQSAGGGNLKLFLDEKGQATNVVNDHFKTQFQILEDLAKNWDKLSVTQKNNIINTIAGTHQYIRGAAAIINFSEALKVAEEAENSKGETQKAFNKELETTKIKIDQLNNAWKGFLVTQEGWFNVAAGKTVDFLRQTIQGMTWIARLNKALAEDKGQPGETGLQWRNRVASKLDADMKAESQTQTAGQKNALDKQSQVAQLEKKNLEEQKSAKQIVRDLTASETKLLEDGVTELEVKRAILKQMIDEARKAGLLDDKGNITEQGLNSKLSKLKNFIAKGDAKNEKTLAQEKEKVVLEDMLAMGANEVQLQIQKIAFEKKRAEETKNTLEVQKQELELQRLITSEIAKSAQELQNVVSNSISSALLGDSTGKDAVQAISKKIRSGFTQSSVDAVTGQLFQLTGLGKTFGTLTTNIQNAFVTGAQQAAPILSQSIVNGAKGIPSTTGGGGGSSSSNFGFGPFHNPGIAGGIVAAGLGALGGVSGGPFNSTGGNVAFGAISSLATAINPVLGGAITLAGGLFSLFKKPKNTVDVKEQEKAIQVASKIDVTNKKLDIVNRNLVALRQTFETFILPESAAFATKRNLEDQFSLNARRGIF